ncbi:MAG: hypothetical protein U0M06_07770, partial [Clostridia bacterium]|nr:hypothetical protein [Clostridia bacterium]
FKVNRNGFGEIILDKKRITKGLRYLKTNEERLALAVLPDVLSKGIEIDSHPKHKGRTYDTFTFAAPVMINGQRGNMAVVVRREQKNYYKVHRLLLPDGTQFLLDEKRDTAERAGGVDNNSGLSPTDNVSKPSISNSTEKVKQKQLKIILKNNPANSDYVTWIRSVDDIYTLQETLEMSDWAEYDEYNPDYSKQDALDAIEKGKILVYSSKPISQGIFVTPSRMEAESYSGDGKVYKKLVNIEDVAWIDPTQGQFAKVDKSDESTGQYSLPDLDTEYIKAVESGDMETAQRMVDEAAKEAGYTQKLYHGTNKFGFTKIDVSNSDDGISFFATDTEETAETYSSGVKRKRISDASESLPDGDAEEIQDEIKSLTSRLSEWCNRNLGIQGWVDYDYFKSKLEDCFYELEIGTPVDSVISNFDGFCDELYFSFADNYYQENYEDNPYLDEEDYLSWEDWQESKEANDLSDEYWNNVAQIIAKFKALDTSANSGVYDLYANTEGMLVVDAKGENWNRLPDPRDADGKLGLSGEFNFRMFTTRDYARYGKAEGYRGVIFKNIKDSGDGSYVKPTTVYIFFNPQEQVKSADPVTYDDKGKVIPLSERFKNDNNDIRYSLPDIDSSGHKLSAGQMEYFKDSKVRDEKGRLIPVYHGSKSAGFTEFTKSDEIGYFFARNIKTSRTYAGGSKAIYAPDKNSPEFSGAANYKVYLDIKKPYIIDGNGANWNQLEANGERVDISIKSQKWNNGSGIAKIQFKYNGKTYSQTVRTSEEFESFISKHTNPEMAKAFAYAMGQAVDKNGKGEFNAGFIWDFKNSVQGDTKNTRDIVRKAYNSHWNYDGVIFKNVVDSGDGSKIKADDLYVVFDSNQIKSVNNTNPTEDKDIRYSLPDIPDIARGKSNEELDKLVSEGKITTKQALDAAREEHGTMPKGENPKVDVTVPKQVSDKRNTRRFVRTVLETGALT